MRVAIRVHVNAAMTLDGAVGGPGRTRLRISNDLDKRRVHALRAQMGAILVGVGTVVADDPKLTVQWDLVGTTGTSPLRVILDPNLRAPAASRVFDDQAPTVSFCASETPPVAGRAVERVPLVTGGLDLAAVLDRLDERGVRRVLVEGGPRTLARFFAEDRVDEFTLFVSSRALGDPSAPRLLERPADVGRGMRIEDATTLGDGLLVTWRRR